MFPADFRRHLRKSSLDNPRHRNVLRRLHHRLHQTMENDSRTHLHHPRSRWVVLKGAHEGASVPPMAQVVLVIGRPPILVEHGGRPSQRGRGLASTLDHAGARPS